MQTLKQYTVDAFARKFATGNPAAVCVMDQWLDEDTMSRIALENNYSETAFTVKENGRYHLRWFTPGGEVELCGHATLATSYVITHIVEPDLDQVEFDTLSGVLTVKKDGDLMVMDFPSYEMKSMPVTDEMEAAVGIRPVKAYVGADTVFVMKDEDQVRKAVPDLDIIRRFEGPCLHITAQGSDYDCVTRSFAPKCGVVEDPVCGRGHCHVIPYWAKELGKDDLKAYQASARGGELYCRYEGERTLLAGPATLFSTAEIYI